MLFQAKQFEFFFPRPTLVMGIVNVTPDSFSDGGKYFSERAAVRHALDLVDQGADMLDVGGESTRPGAIPVSEREEFRRIIPVIETLAKKVKLPISVDTMKPRIAGAALKAGASIINDVAAHYHLAAMAKLAVEYQAGYICVHAQGKPRTMQKNPVYKNVIQEVGAFFSRSLMTLQSLGVKAVQVVFDPGIGFGKTVDHNLQLLAGLDNFGRGGRPLMVGVSRKSLIEKISGAKPNQRLPASLACATLAIESGVNIIRAHDVAETVQAVRMVEAILSRKANVD